ncbi:MAG TPA: hypothetical protein PLF27_03400 [Sedimentibacter sp.]|jgi:hypothetical protein|nr:hypothetical protein [Sedimentibacter sp.]HRC80413.1 hypothetical protein [Sedimentibacter sp.]
MNTLRLSAGPVLKNWLRTMVTMNDKKKNKYNLGYLKVLPLCRRDKRVRTIMPQLIINPSEVGARGRLITNKTNNTKLISFFTIKLIIKLLPIIKSAIFFNNPYMPLNPRSPVNRELFLALSSGLI